MELLREGQLSELAAAGVWQALALCVAGRPAVVQQLADLGICDVAAAEMRAMDPADWLSLSRGNRFQSKIAMISTMIGEGQVEVVIQAGIFDLCLSGITAFASRGIEALPDTHAIAA